MAEFFSYDPLTGIREEFEYDSETGEAKIHSYQDIEPLLRMAHTSRVNGLRDKGIKESWFHYCSIPPIYQLKLRQKGLDVGNPAHTDRILAEINTNMPELKFTTKNEGGRVKQHFLLK